MNLISMKMKVIFVLFLFYLNFVCIVCDQTKDASIDDNSIDKNEISEKSMKQIPEKSTESSDTSENTSTKSDVSTETVIQTTEKITEKTIKRGFIGSLSSGLSSGLSRGVSGFSRGAKALISGKKSGGDGGGDQILKAFKGEGQDEQTDEQQGETDSFFGQFKNSNGRVCYKDIGCFAASEYNDYTGRPITVTPQPPEIIKTHFLIYTPDTREQPRNFSYNATQSQLRYSNFDPKLKTAMIIHGFQSGLSLWMENMKDYVQYQSGDAYNVILVIWENGAKNEKYSTAVANTRVVGACIGVFINTLCKTYEIKNDMFYLIGHCLGAHAAGYAGKRLTNPKISRITALDPAGIGFYLSYPALRLDSTDAKLVDVIHTDIVQPYTDGFGTKETMGDFDFFPNGGAWQPGCPDASGIVQRLATISNAEDISCSHTRASTLLYDLDKPEDDCSAVAYQCPNYEMFLEGLCADCREEKCKLMGINPSHWDGYNKTDNKTIGKRYFIQTSNIEEFCLYHFQFGVHISADSDSTTGILIFTMRLQVSENEIREVEVTKIMTKTYQDKIHTFLMTFKTKILRITSLSLQWQRYNSSERYRVNRGYKLKIPFIQINFMSSLDESIRSKHSSILCSDNSKIIVNRDKKEFKFCEPSNFKLATEVDPKTMLGLEWKDDIYAVDFARTHRVFHKIPTTRIRDKIKKSEIVD